MQWRSLVGGRAPTTERPLVVLESVPGPLPTTNPYNVMLMRALAKTPGVTMLPFTWRHLVLGRYDVFHVHWLEAHLSGPVPIKNLVRQVLALIGLIRLRVLRRALVRTQHNLELPTGISRRELWLLRLAERWTTMRLLINESTPHDGSTRVATILHGHYRDWFAARTRTPSVPGRLVFFGRIRRYKNVDGLIAAFGDTGRAEQAAGPLSLHVAGRPSSQELTEVLADAARQDPRVSVQLGFVEDQDLVAAVSAAELVVLPYREMHNSGSILTALSLDRPVLVPDNEANRALASEVGPEWVLRYSGPLTGEDLVGAVSALRARPPVASPNLHRRDWDTAGVAHLAAFREAVTAARRRRRAT